MAHRIRQFQFDVIDAYGVCDFLVEDFKLQPGETLGLFAAQRDQQAINLRVVEDDGDGDCAHHRELGADQPVAVLTERQAFQLRQGVL